MRAHALLMSGTLLAVLVAGCMGDEPAPGPDAATAMALRPTVEELGQPADWGAAIGQGPREPKGETRLLMAFGVETTNPEGSRLVDGLYNMREHIREDATVGDGATGHWLYQHADESSITMQRVASADGRSDGAAYGAMWDWSYWGLASGTAVTEWTIDSDAAAEAAAGAMANWSDPERDHLYLLYVPEGHSAAHWLLGLWNLDGTVREHVVVHATTGAIVPFDSVHPDEPERGTEEGTLAVGTAPDATYTIEPSGNRSRLVLRVVTEPAGPAGAVTVSVETTGWQEVTRDTEGTAHEVVLESLGGGPVEVTLHLDGIVSRYTLEWCAEGRFNDILGRTPTACDA